MAPIGFPLLDATGASVAVEDIANHPEFRYADVLCEHGIVSVRNVPIFVDGEPQHPFLVLITLRGDRKESEALRLGGGPFELV